ncbi:hypothetical protein [Bosea sp. R86505]|uniref:hypothetical protein n=1 Tax=Bosea sp. R86505 TaxID=3101710 RepID=UPI00366AE3AF
MSTSICSRADMAAVIAHFHVVKGWAYSFRFKDRNDYAAADKAIVQITPRVWQIVNATTARAMNTSARSPSRLPDRPM